MNARLRPGLVLALAIAALVATAGLRAGLAALPDPLFSDPVSAVLLDRDGRLLAARVAADEQWRFPPRTHVPERFATAIVTFEDRRFFLHPGVDPIALARAFLQNRRAGHVVSGGSTLTMQLVRMARHRPERTYGEKLLEAMLALRIELAHSKSEILALYASHAPFGGNVVGIDAAAWRYFGRGAESLSWAEAALLAVLPNSPALMHPGRARDALRAKRDALLERLASQGDIDPLECDLAKAEPLPRRPKALPRLAPRLLETAALEAGGPGRFETTIDARLQKRALRVVATHAGQLEARGIRHAAAVILDNESFEVLAYVGNVPGRDDAGDDRDTGDAIDLLQRPRSTGSILKPFLYAAMLQHGELLPDQIIPDIPTQIGGYHPENFDRAYRGAVPASQALARSLNVPAVRMLQDFGVGRFRDVLEQMGMTTLFRSADDYGLSLILGGAEGTPFELAGLYANLARAVTARPGSERRLLHPVVRVGRDPRTRRGAIIGAGAAWLTLEALETVQRPGIDAAWRRFASARRVAWKTGTSFGYRDAWAIGTTPEFTVAVWIGNASGAGVPELIGVRAAAPLLFELFRQLPRSTGFEPPTWDLKPVRVCVDDGYLASDACMDREILVPLASHFAIQTPYHHRVHLDARGAYQVDARCAKVREMVHRDAFVLPPPIEVHYRRTHPSYRPLPDWHPDCATPDASALDLVYPTPGTRIYIPIDLGGERSRTIFEAAHRRPGSTVYWHLDARYVGATHGEHKLAIFAAPGWHTITLVDDRGVTLSRRFLVLDPEADRLRADPRVALGAPLR